VSIPHQTGSDSDGRSASIMLNASLGATANSQTPWLVSSLPSPPTLIDPNMVNDKNKEDGEDEDDTMDGPEDGDAKTKAEVTRSVGGEVKWWSNVVEIQPTGPKDPRYNWVGVNGEYQIIDKRRTC